MRARLTIVVTLIAALTLTLVIGGCGGGGEAILMTLFGRVLDDGSLDPVLGARVIAAGGQEDTTAVDGTFEFDGSGNSVTVTATGYQTQTVAVPAATGFVDLGDIYLQPAPLAGAGNITGTVTEGGVVAAGATVRAGGRTAITRANGVYTLYNVPAGNQTVFAVNQTNTTGGSTNVNVLAGQTIVVNLQLTTQPPFPPVIN